MIKGGTSPDDIYANINHRADDKVVKEGAASNIIRRWPYRAWQDTCFSNKVCLLCHKEVRARDVSSS